MPEAVLRHLPKKARALWEATYRNLRAKGYDVEKSAKIAWGVVKKKYIKKKGRWILRSTKIKHRIAKSSLFSDYTFQIELSNTRLDADGQRVSKSLLQRIVDEGRITKYGDVEHERFYNELGKPELRDMLGADKGTIGLYELVDYWLEGDRLMAIVKLNKSHSLYKKYVKLHKQGKLRYASAEFINADINDNNEIVDADMMRWSITDYPSNLDLNPAFELNELERMVGEMNNG